MASCSGSGDEEDCWGASPLFGAACARHSLAIRAPFNMTTADSVSFGHPSRIWATHLSFGALDMCAMPFVRVVVVGSDTRYGDGMLVVRKGSSKKNYWLSGPLTTRHDSTNPPPSQLHVSAKCAAEPAKPRRCPGEVSPINPRSLSLSPLFSHLMLLTVRTGTEDLLPNYFLPPFHTNLSR